MDCEQFDQVVLDLLYGEADEEQSVEAKRHADACERCATTLADLRRIRKSTSIPLVDPPEGFERKVLEAARHAQSEIPWPRRLGRWVSWVGGYAMKPQLAMAALLLLMIGSSLLLIRGRPGSEQVGVVRVTEQGVPEREGADQVISPDPAQLPPRTGGMPEAHKSKPNGQPRGPARTKSNAPVNTDSLTEPSVNDGATERFAEGQSASPTGNRSQLNNMQSPAAPASAPPPPDGYAQAMGMYRARDYANAYRAFDIIVLRGGANASSAALYAAKAVRASSGCTNALPRFESVIARFGDSGAGVEAKWEAATCARIVGDYTRARILYRELAQVQSQRERAERELARISSPARQRAAKPSASASDDNNKNTEKKARPADNAFDSAY